MPPFDLHLPGSYWVAIIAGAFLVAQSVIAYYGSRKADASADLRALVEALQEEMGRRIDEITDLRTKHAELEAKLEVEVAVRKKAELDRDHCIGALAREKELSKIHLEVIDKLKADIAEVVTQRDAAHAEALRLRAIIHAIDPEHPDAAP